MEQVGLAQEREFVGVLTGHRVKVERMVVSVPQVH